LTSLMVGVGCVDLTAPWITHPRVGGAVIGGSPMPGDGGSQDTGGAPTETVGGSGGVVSKEDATVPSGGGASETGGVPSGGGATILDAQAATGGQTMAGGSRLDAPIATGGIRATGGRVATGGATIVDAPQAKDTLIATGGLSLATGGTVIPYNCATPLALTGGTVTNFSDWNSATSTWGNRSRLSGGLFQYQAAGATINPLKVEGTPLGIHITGTIPSGYGGVVLRFDQCTNVSANIAVGFDIYGKAKGCRWEVIIQNWDQRPVDETPPGGCLQDAGTACYKSPGVFPNLDLQTDIPSTAPASVVKLYSTFSNWTAAKATQVIGLQWQFTSLTANPTIENTCTIDVTIGNIRFQ